ncbi:MAG: hypothetical protein KJ914_14390 [Gammaproteobacteria bacterium]|nr:hypothetical protein [Gammaproteobacteria bacterium]MBU1723398.1 hypothetical protein [Gammaproteobacteria bacterium]MBU2006980.1 hypothetical protein [Gammaproteobacteria bacterium]
MGSETASRSILQQRRSPDFSGAHESQVVGSESFSMSGLSNGEHFYRLQSAADQSRSNTLTVKVQPHSLGKSWLFFTVGAWLGERNRSLDDFMLAGLRGYFPIGFYVAALVEVAISRFIGSWQHRIRRHLSGQAGLRGRPCAPMTPSGDRLKLAANTCQTRR